jgi:hypothetical protein
MKHLLLLIFLSVNSLTVKAQDGNVLQSKSFDDVEISIINFNSGKFIMTLNFLGENDKICNKGLLLTIIDILKKADTKKEYSNFSRLKINDNEIKFMVRHDKKSTHIDIGEFDDFKKGNEKKVNRGNTQALISYLEQWLDIISCD